MLGRRIGKFRVVEKLGEGGMGSVWKAEDTVLGRMVALKFLPESLADAESARQRFLREARSTSGLEHPHIATLYEAGEIDGRLYLAVAFVDGETVAHRVARGPLEPREALRIAAEVAEALAHAHGRGIVHRDVTARNVMIARDGRTIVIDFGLALREHTTRLTTTGVTFGTIPYLAPEVVRGAAADARSDLYGLGVVLYEMLTGRLPFAHEQGVAAMYAAAHRRPDPPSAHVPELPAAVDRVVLRLLARDPERRPRSAADVANELRAVFATPAERTVTGRPPSTPPPAAGARRTVAIFPFGRVEARSDPAPTIDADDALADGLAEVLSVSLSHSPLLRVVPPSVVRSAHAFAHDPRSAAHEFGATLFVQGHVRRSGARLRVTFAVLDARRGTEIAGETLDGTLDDLFALEDSLVLAAGRALRVQLAPRLRRPRPADAGQDLGHEKYLRALGYLQRSDQRPMIEGAVRLLEELLAEEGDTAVVHAALGRACLVLYEMTFDPDALRKAEASCRAALALDPHSPDVLVTLGRLEHRLGRNDAAIAALSRSLALRPQNPDALLSLGRALEAEGRFDEALQAAQEMVRLQPGSWLGHNRVAMVHFRRGEYEQAVEPWEKVLELTPDNANVLTNLGSAKFQIGQLDEALAFYQRALAVSPTAVACSGAGTVLFFQGRASEAVKYFQRGVALSPRDARAWGNLGDAQRWVAGSETDSRASFDRAIELARAQACVNPNDPENLARLALWLAKRGRAPESLATLERALALAPDHPGVLGRAVSVYHLAGDAARARECLPRALARGYSWVELRRDPELDALQQDPETKELLTQVETAHLAALTRGGNGEES